MLAQVQGIRCLAADVGEMTLHTQFASHFSHLLGRVTTSSLSADLRAPASRCMEGATGHPW